MKKLMNPFCLQGEKTRKLAAFDTFCRFAKNTKFLAGSTGLQCKLSPSLDLTLNFNSKAIVMVKLWFLPNNGVKV